MPPWLGRAGVAGGAKGLVRGRAGLGLLEGARGWEEQQQSMMMRGPRRWLIMASSEAAMAGGQQQQQGMAPQRLSLRQGVLVREGEGRHHGSRLVTPPLPTLLLLR